MQSLENLFDISGKKVLVTGGASGIGLMMTETLVDAGCTVYIASRKESALKSVADHFNQTGPGTVIPIVADIATKEGTELLAKTLSEKLDHLDVLINNSGRSWGDTLENFPRDAWDKVLTLNVTAMADLTRLLLPLLEKNASHADPARVINVGSVMGTRPKASVSAENEEAAGTGAYSYVVSKAAVHHLTRMLSNELAARHITVNAIAPGPFPSRMMRFATDTEEKRQQTGSTVPLGRVGEPEDIACLIRWLLSKGGGYISGAIVPIDGGMSAMG